MSKPNMIKRADGSYSQRGLWDNIRANKGSGKSPTKEMLKQEKKIKAKYDKGGEVDNINNVPIPSPLPSKQNFKFKNYQDLKTLPVKLNSNNFSPYTNIPDKKIIGSEDYKDPLTNILNQTIADQTNLGRGYNVGSEILSSYENPYLKTINSGLEFVKSKTPIIGDLLINTGQEALSGVDNYLKNNNNYNSRLHDKIKNMKYNNGGTIHIKPENKGKFNATKKATGKTTEELTHSKNPVTKKRAIFAQNAAKWHHADGGEILPKYADAGWLAKNKSGVGAGLGFAGDTTNLLFDNNVFGTHNQVTDSEGNILGEAQSDAASQTQGALSGALKGASAGAVLGPWGMAGGALIGGAVGLLSADTGAEDKLNQIKRERNAQISFKNMLGKGPIANNLTQTNNQSYYAGGGEIKNPNLAGNDLNFQKWYRENTLEGRKGIPFNPDNLDYDYYSMYKSGIKGNPTQHFPDTYKLPNHSTFSDESLYSGNGAKGYWEGNKFKTYSKGGMKTLNQDHPEATEEVELGESAMLPNGANVAFGGEKHENGGLETNLPEGTRIFSDRIKSGKRTIASIAKPIQNKIEKLKDNNSKAALNTTKLFEKQLDNLFNEQEEIKQKDEMKKSSKLFADGGKKDIFSNPEEFINKPIDISPVRIGNENTVSTEYQNRPYQFDKELTVAKKTFPIEKIEPVKKAMINNAPKAQSFQPLAADAQAMYEEKKKNPAWKNFKGNYSIYSKENSMLHLFDNEHNLIDQTRAGRGVGKGDTPNLADAKNWYDSNKPKKGQEAAIKAATTPAGAYAIQEGPVEEDYATKVYRFDKPNKHNVQKAMHGIYKGDAYNRTKIINDPNIKQAFVSNGCLNIPASFLNKYDNQINTGDSLFITKEPKFDRGGTTEEDLPYSKKRQYMLDYLQGKYQTENQKEDAVINYRNNQNVERQQVNDELGAQLDAENGNIVNPYNQNINTIQPRSINNLKVNNTFNQPNNINSYNFKTKTINPLMTATDYQPGSYGFATDPVLNLNQPVIKPNYVPANSDQADYEYLKANPDIMKRGNIQPRPLSTLSPLDVKGTKMISPINNGKPFDLNQVKSNIAAEANLNKTPPPSEPRFNKGDIGTAGALGTSLLGNLIQRSNLNKVAPPRTLVAPTFTAGRTPVKADYSADLQSADNQFNAARRGVMMNSGNYSTQAGNLGQLRAEQLRNRSKILQNQNNANAVLMNEYQKAQADAINKNALSNYTTDQENMENLYNYNLWKTGQTNAADANATNTSGQVFNNMITGQNQLDAAEMYRRMYAPKIREDLGFKKAKGGMIKKRTLRK